MSFIIKRERADGRSEYLYKNRPTRFVDKESLALRMSKEKASRESSWLSFIGLDHTLIETDELGNQV